MIIPKNRYRFIAVFSALFLLLMFVIAHADSAPLKLRVGGTGSVPFSQLGFDGNGKGLFPELLDDVASKENWQIEYVHCEWQKCTEMLEKGQLDLMMEAADNEERLRRFDFNKTTLANSWGQLFTTTNGAGAKVESLLDLEGLRVAVIANNVISDRFKKLLSDDDIKVTFVEFASYADVLTSLEFQEVDAGVVSYMYSRVSGQMDVVRSTSIVFSPVDLRFMARKGTHADLLETIDRHLHEQIATPGSKYHKSMRKILITARKSPMPFWVKVLLVSTVVITFVFFININLLSKLVARRTTDLQREIASRKEEQIKLELRNSEMAVLELELRGQLTKNNLVLDALRISNDKYRKELDDAPVGIIHTSLEGSLLSINPAFVRMFGYESAAEMYAAVDDFNLLYCFPEKRPKMIQQVLASDGYLHWDNLAFYRKDGSSFYANANLRAVRSEEGELQYLECFLLDVTQQKIAQEALKDSEQTLRLYIRNLPLACMLLDRNCAVMSWNLSSERIFGYAEVEALGKPLGSLIKSVEQEPDSSVDWGMLLCGDEVSSLVKESVAKDGRTILCEWTNTRFFDGSGRVNGVIAVAMDITARRQAEEMLVQSEKMMMIGGLAAGMAHEINNPMGIIVQNVQNIMRRISPELPVNNKVAGDMGLSLIKVREYLEKREIIDFIAKIGDAGQRTTRIVANLLNFSRQNNPGRQPVRLAEVIEQSLEMVVKDHDLLKQYNFANIRISKDFPADMPHVSINIVELEQVLINLLKNAAQALAEIVPYRDPEITISLCCEDGDAVIRVADNGPGIPEKIRKRLFEPFYTTKAVGKGTGLGLYVSYVLISRYDRGMLSVDSVPGEGACFTIRFALV